MLKCSACKHLTEYGGFGGTEVTGSSPPEITCMKRHWDFDFDDARKSLRVIQLKGANCQDFEPDAP